MSWPEISLVRLDLRKLSAAASSARFAVYVSTHAFVDRAFRTERLEKRLRYVKYSRGLCTYDISFSLLFH